MRVAAVLPCYRSSEHAPAVVRACLQHVDIVVCIDDGCPEGTGDLLLKYFQGEQRIIVIKHPFNQGVGSAVKTGIKYLQNSDIDIYVKVDSDGQMNPELIPELISPIEQGIAQFCKGNRFRDTGIITSMPFTRLVGNAGLSFITKLSTGYWELFDPTNGFIAISHKAVNRIRIEKTDNRYFFETDLLFRCSLANIKIQEIAMRAMYGNETSSLNPLKELVDFSRKHCLLFLKRISYQYFLLEINPGSLELVGGILTGLAALIIGSNSLLSGLSTGVETPAGTQTLFLALMIISLQLILGFIYYDSAFRPLLREIKSKE